MLKEISKAILKKGTKTLFINKHFLVALTALVFLSADLFFSYFSYAAVSHSCDHQDKCYICKCIQAVNTFQSSLDVPAANPLLFKLFIPFFDTKTFVFQLSLVKETPVSFKVKKTE